MGKVPEDFSQEYHYVYNFLTQKGVKGELESEEKRKLAPMCCKILLESG